VVVESVGQDGVASAARIPPTGPGEPTGVLPPPITSMPSVASRVPGVVDGEAGWLVVGEQIGEGA